MKNITVKELLSICESKIGYELEWNGCAFSTPLSDNFLEIDKVFIRKNGFANTFYVSLEIVVDHKNEIKLTNYELKTVDELEALFKKYFTIKSIGL